MPRRWPGLHRRAAPPRWPTPPAAIAAPLLPPHTSWLAPIPPTSAAPPLPPLPSIRPPTRRPGSPPPRPCGPLPKLIFASRWLQLPLYLGLIVAQGVYVVHFLVELLHLVEAAFGSETALQALITSIGYKTDRARSPRSTRR